MTVGVVEFGPILSPSMTQDDLTTTTPHKWRQIPVPAH